MDATLKQRLVEAQRDEISEHHVYQRLAKREKDAHNREVLERIAADEKKHYDFFAERTGEQPPPKRWKVRKFVWIARLLGLTFAIKLMERGEENAQDNYGEIAETLPEAQGVAEDEGDHERELTNMIDEERLRYVGSVVLGLSDALVELTGALAGLTLALRDTRLIALIGMITGIAAALSMAASEFLSTRAEEDGHKSPVKAAIYTGFAYILTVAALVAPYLLMAHAVAALGIAVAAAMLIILIFSYYISVAREQSFVHRFGEMAGLSLGVAAISFFIGYLLRLWLGVDA